MKKHKKLIFAITLPIAIIAVIFFGIRWYFRLPVLSYYTNSEKAFVIPEIGKGFVPQGFDYHEQTNTYFVSGYAQKGASPVFLISEDKQSKKIFLKESDGELYDGHGGGIALFDEYIYIAGSSDYCFYVYSLTDALNAENEEAIECLGAFSTKHAKGDYVKVSCVTTDGEYIYAVEFFSDPDYKTLKSHKLTTNAGDYNQAIAVAYKLNASAEFGIESAPACAYSLPDKVQGLEIHNGKAYLSRSLGLKHSTVSVYDISKSKQEKTVQLLGQDLPLYAFDSHSLIAEKKIQPMSEEMIILDGKLLVMSEFACNKYILGKFASAKWCYATPLEYFS